MRQSKSGIESTPLVLYSTESAFAPGLVPAFDPGIGAKREAILPKNLAFLLVSSCLLQAKEPFVVTVPTVESLVLRGESSIARSRTNVLDLMQKVLLLLRESRNLFAENLFAEK